MYHEEVPNCCSLLPRASPSTGTGFACQVVGASFELQEYDEEEEEEDAETKILQSVRKLTRPRK